MIARAGCRRRASGRTWVSDDAWEVRKRKANWARFPPGTIPAVQAFVEPFTDDEVAVLSRFFTNVDRPVFALSISPKSSREPFRPLQPERQVAASALPRRVRRRPRSRHRESSSADRRDPLLNMERAERLYQRVFVEYGDDSVAQLGGAHLAVEQASNLLTKALEWGRLAAYLEQSTRYIPYDARLGDRYRYVIPPEIEDSPLAPTLRLLGRTRSSTPTARCWATMKEHYERRFPLPEGESPGAVGRIAPSQGVRRGPRGASGSHLVQCWYIRQRAGLGDGARQDAAPTRSGRGPPVRRRHAGGTSQGDPLVPSPGRRPGTGRCMDRPIRTMFGSRLEDMAAASASRPAARARVSLIDWDEDAEIKSLAAALYPASTLPDR